MANLKGRCVNIGGGCSKALSKEIIEADEYNFVCPECGRNLVKIQNNAPDKSKDTNGNGNRNGGGGDGKRKRIIILSTVAILVAVVIVILGFSLDWFGGKKTAGIDNPGQGLIEDTISEPKGPHQTGTDTEDGKKDKDTEVLPQPISSSVFGGAATRKGNVITFNKPYRINLHTLDKDYIDVPANAKIISCIFDGNYLIQGELVIDGESQLLSGIKERLK